MTVREAAAHFGVSTTTIYRRIRSGKLRVVDGTSPWEIHMDSGRFTTAEAIARANELLTADEHVGPDAGSQYFSTAHLAFWLAFCADQGVSTDDDYFTEAEIARVVKGVSDNYRLVDEQTAADYRVTAQTEGPPRTRVTLPEIFEAVAQSWFAKNRERDPHQALRASDRPAVFRFAADAGIVIYTELWPNRPPGDSFVLAEDRDEVFAHLYRLVSQLHGYTQTALAAECSGLRSNVASLRRRLGLADPGDYPPAGVPATYAFRDRLKRDQKALYGEWALRRERAKVEQQERDAAGRERRAREAAAMKERIAREKARREAESARYRAEQDRLHRPVRVQSCVDQLNAHLSYHLDGEPDEAKIAILRQALAQSGPMADEWAEAARIVAAANGWEL